MYCHHCLYDCFAFFILPSVQNFEMVDWEYIRKFGGFWLFLAPAFPPFQQWCEGHGEGEPIGEVNGDRVLFNVRGNME